MPVAPVDEHGTHLSYIDSGPVEGETYTTLVCVHGHSYHSGVFRRLLAFAHEHNMRIVALDRRDYNGSTPFSTDELDQLNDGDFEVHKAFLRARGLEIARFLSWFVETQRIPRASDDKQSGGLALLGWSIGNMTTLAFLRHVDSFSTELIQTLEPYLRTLFIYDAAYSSLGIAPPADIHSPPRGTNVSETARMTKQGILISSYYKHPNPSSRTISGLQIDAPTFPYRPATNETIAYDDLLRIIDSAPGACSERGFTADAMRGPLLDQRRGALFDADRACVLPEINVRMIYCTESPWSIYWALWEIEKDIRYWKAEGVQGRPLEIIKVEGANHFLHWDDPKRALTLFSGSLTTDNYES